jgi:hypothetical protein
MLIFAMCCTSAPWEASAVFKFASTCLTWSAMAGPTTLPSAPAATWPAM